MLKVERLSAGYTDLPVIVDVSITVEEGQFVSIVGPNGAGKTTLFKTISGILAPKSGGISFEGADLAAVPAARRPHLGIAHVPEGRQVFPSLTVMENLEMGAFTEAGRRNWKTNLEKIFTWLPVLADRRSQLAGTLSGGEQQMVAVGRGLASSPKLLMLDEPSMGLAPTIADFIFEKLMEIRRQTAPHHPAGRAARGRGAGIGRPRLCAGGRPRRAGRQQRKPARQRPGAPGLSRHVKETPATSAGMTRSEGGNRCRSDHS